MKKLYIITFFALLSSLFNSVLASDSPVQDISFTVTSTLQGVTTVTNNDYIWGQSWSIEYGIAGFAPGTGIMITGISSQSRNVQVNIFEKFDFRIKMQFTDWSQTVTINTCTDSTVSSGISNDFNNWSADSCWKGYVFPSTQTQLTTLQINTNNIIYYGASGKSLSMASTTSNSSYGMMMVLPKINDLGTDKKLKFMVKNYSGGLQVGTLSVPNDPSTFSLIAAVPVQTNLVPWEEKNIYFTNYNGTDQYIAIRYVRGSGGMPAVYLDDISYEQSVDCYTPIDVTSTSIDEFNHQASFNAPGAQFEIQLTNNTTGFVQTISTDQNPYIFTGLAGNNSYKYRVRGNCDVGMNSVWSPFHFFTTPCSGINAGFNTSFEEFQNLDPCWNKIIAGTGNVQTSSGTAVLPESGIKMVRLSNTNNNTATKAYLISRYVHDLDQTKRLRFSLISNGSSSSNQASLVVGTMTDPNDDTTFHPLQTITPSEMSEYRNTTSVPSWKQHTVYFDIYDSTNNDHYIAIKHGNDGIATFFIDNYKYEQRPACPEPLYASVSNISYNSALLGWQNAPGSTATTWEIEYGPSGFTVGTGTIVTTTSNSFLLENLPFDDTEYDLYVRAICGVDSSAPSYKMSFRTKCFGVTIGYSESFEADGDLNTCWTGLTPQMESYSPSPSSYISVNTSTAHSGTKSIRHSAQQSSIGAIASLKTILVSPRLIDLDTYKRISFWMKCTPSNYSSPHEIIVGTLSNPDDSETFTPFRIITDANIDEGQWRNYEVDFSGYSGTDMYVGIRQGASNSSQLIYIDDFLYYDVLCPTATELTASQAGATSTLLGWDDNNTDQPTLSWEIEYGPENFVSGTGTVINVTTNPFTLQGLENFTVYEYRVRNKCDVDIYGDWSSKKKFKISCTVTAPFYENFDQYNASMSGATSGIPGFCWTRHDHYVTELVAGCITGITSCPNTMRLNAMFPDSLNENTSAGFLVSPYLSDFDNTKKLKFWVFGDFSYEPSQLIVGTMSNPLDKATFVPFQTLNLSSLSTNGQQFVINFASYTGNDKHIAFLHDASFEYSYMYIDDVYYAALANCEEPVNVLTQDIEAVSANIRWDAANGANEYAIEYGLHGFTQGTGTVVTTTATQKLITGLLPETAYQYYIRTICASENSVIVGPRPFTTTCVPLSLPWVENFDAMAAYGLNVVPECFSSSPNVRSSNVPIMPFGGSGSDLLTGIGDTHFLRMNEDNNAHIFSPVFSLIAGTTYQFSINARKGYEWDFTSIDAKVGRGNNWAAMETSLAGIGTIHEYQYNPRIFYYTPIVSGVYGYLLTVVGTGGLKVVLDKFELSEGYDNIINENSTVLDFENGADSSIILESSQFNSIDYESDGTNTYLRMNGGGDYSWNSNVADMWLSNQEYITKVNMKIDAGAMENIYLSFNLKQTFDNVAENSIFRVVANGIALGEIMPMSQSNDAFQTFEYDLSAFAGSDLRISLQHLGKSIEGTGDTAFLDNIQFSPTSLGSPQQNFSQLKIYPNPAENNIIIDSTNPIGKIEIVSITGQLLFSNKFDNSKVNLDISNYSSGIYFVRIESNEEVKTFKFIKK